MQTRKSKSKANAPEVFDYLHNFKEVMSLEVLPCSVRSDSE